MNRAETRPPSRSLIDLESDYNPEFTKESYKELKNLAFWAKAMGPEFFLIGGWAAWRYHRGVGSRDIDVVFPDRRILDMFLTNYYKRNGYETYGVPFSNRYRKRLVVGGTTVLVEIDATSISDGPPFKEDRTRTISFELLGEHSDLWDLGDAAVRIPHPELLILQKAKAHRDRVWNLEHVAISPVDSARLRSKISKDEYDISNIAPLVGDWDVVWAIAEKCRSRDLIEDTFHALRIKTR